MKTSEADIELFGRSAVAALTRAIDDKEMTDEHLRELYAFLIKNGFVRLVGGEEETESAAVEQAEESDGAPAAPGGDDEAVSPPAPKSPPTSPKPGSRNNPILAKSPDDVDKAGRRARRPTEAQAKAGNYRAGHLMLHGLPIAIETPKGRVRRGKDADGKSWSVKMPLHYGRLTGTKGADDDAVDIFVGPHIDSGVAYVIDQNDAETGKFDETKVVLGARSEREAARFYAASFSDGKGRKRIGGITEMTIKRFKRWLNDGGGREPLSGQK